MPYNVQFFTFHCIVMRQFFKSSVLVFHFSVLKKMKSEKNPKSWPKNLQKLLFGIFQSYQTNASVFGEFDSVRLYVHCNFVIHFFLWPLDSGFKHDKSIWNITPNTLQNIIPKCDYIVLFFWNFFYINISLRLLCLNKTLHISQFWSK